MKKNNQEYVGYTTDYQAGQDNLRLKIGRFEADVHFSVFVLTALLVIALVSFCLLFADTAANIFGTLRPWLTSKFDWVFAASMNIFVIFCVYLIFSPYAHIKIGGQDAKPEYNRLSWFAMLFAAGMGIGLVFYGVLEPMQHIFKLSFSVTLKVLSVNSNVQCWELIALDYSIRKIRNTIAIVA